MTTTCPGAVRPKTLSITALPREQRPPTRLRRAALAVSEALAAWAVDSPRNQQRVKAPSARAVRADAQAYEAERRRDAAINQLLELPRQF